MLWADDLGTGNGPKTAVEAPVKQTLPATGGPSPHDLLWGAGAVGAGLGLITISRRRTHG